MSDMYEELFAATQQHEDAHAAAASAAAAAVSGPADDPGADAVDDANNALPQERSLDDRRADFARAKMLSMDRLAEIDDRKQALKDAAARKRQEEVARQRAFKEEVARRRREQQVSQDPGVHK
jgi:hypothetical protein